MALQTESAVSPMPFLSTSSRAIAESMSSSSSMLCNPSPANLPSMVSATSSFFPMRRKHDVCIAPSEHRNFTRTGRLCPILQDLRLACRKVCSEYPDRNQNRNSFGDRSRLEPEFFFQLPEILFELLGHGMGVNARKPKSPICSPGSTPATRRLRNR